MSDPNMTAAEHAYWEGAASRQAEIDALQKRIDEAMELLEYNEYTDSHLQALDVLKGELK